MTGSFLCAVQRHGVGDAQAVVIPRLVPFGAQLLIHLRPKTVHQHQLDAHGVKYGEVLGERIQLARGDEFTRNCHHKSFAVIGVNVRRHRTEPRHKGMGEN